MMFPKRWMLMSLELLVLPWCPWCHFYNPVLPHDRTQVTSNKFQWDNRGYIIFCLCLGRFGNQVDQLLGGLAFAKEIDRTLILPPFRTTYKWNTAPFDEWLRLDAIQKYHRVILADDFMEQLAPSHWPSGTRTGFCYSATDTECKIKGTRFGHFWKALGVDFDNYISITIPYNNTRSWKKSFPPKRYPVLALRSAPATFPVEEKNVPLQKYLKWSATIEHEAIKHIQELFNGEKFIGLHLRNGVDWQNTCKHVDGRDKKYASAQCLGYKGDKLVTQNMCFPSKKEILRLTKKIVLLTKVKNIFVATDMDPMIKDIETGLRQQKVKVVHLDPWLPQIDLAILGKSDHFIGNCISTFTAFVSRERLANDKPTSFWGFS